MSNQISPDAKLSHIPMTLRLKCDTATVFLSLLPTSTIHDLKKKLLSALKESQRHLDSLVIPASTAEIRLALPKDGTAAPTPGSGSSQVLTENTVWIPLSEYLVNFEGEEGGGGRKGNKNKGKGKSKKSEETEEGRKGEDDFILSHAKLRDGGIMAFRVVKEGEEESAGEGFEVKVPRDEYGDEEEEEEEEQGEEGERMEE